MQKFALPTLLMVASESESRASPAGPGFEPRSDSDCAPPAAREWPRR